MTQHLSTLTLHRMRYGELSDAEVADLRSHVDECETCATRLRAQENHRAAFELQRVPDAIRQTSEDLLRIPEPANSPWRWSRWLAVGLVAVAALLLAVPMLDTSPTDSGYEPTRVKGGATDVEAWVDTPEGPAAVGRNDLVHPGDRIQVRFRRPPHRWVTLAGKDGGGTFELYGSWKADMESGDWQLAPFALELDATPGDQDLFLVFQPERPDESAVRRALSAQRTPHGATVWRLVLEKSR